LSRARGKKVLVFGGAGMIGSAVSRLLVIGGAEVTIVDAMLPMYGGNLFNIESIKNEVNFIKGDIREKDLVQRVVKGVDIIFNLAAQVSYVDSSSDPHFDMDINCGGHLNILEACRSMNRDAVLVFSSSRFVYGSIEYNPVDERHPFNCLSIYGIHKLTCEKYHQFYSMAYGLRSIVFRIANPYGPGQQMKHGKYGIANWFIRMAMEGEVLTIYGDGMQKRDYIFVEDLAEAMVLASMIVDSQHQVFNIGSGVGVTFKEMVNSIADISGSKISHVEWPKDRYLVETGDYVTDILHLCSKIKWEPKIELLEGIKLTWDYYRKYKEKYW
jgi:nucleoside-diphosphate-sugar epimerase